MEPANQIRIALAKVTGLRTDAREDPRLDESVRWVKQFQTKRFESTYSDLIADGPYRGATRFFLDELYGEVSYAERDAQFSKIAGAKSPSVTGPHDSYSPIDRHNVQGGVFSRPSGSLQHPIARSIRDRTQYPLLPYLRTFRQPFTVLKRQDALARRHHAHRDVAAGVHAAAGGAGTPAPVAPDPIPRGAGAERLAAGDGGASGPRRAHQHVGAGRYRASLRTP